MQKIIKNRQIIDSNWNYIQPESLSQENLQLPDGDIVVSVSDWQTFRELCQAHSGKLGLILQSDEEPSCVQDDLEHFEMIAINFPVFGDGRGYSSARELRTRYQYQGEIRATGDVLRDQLQLMERCGFNAFEVRKDRDLEEAMSGFSDFTFNYQADVSNPLPSFRRD